MMEELQTYVKVWMPDVGPETYYVDTLQGALETLRYTIEENDESEGICFAPVQMTEKEFNELPEFTGF